MYLVVRVLYLVAQCINAGDVKNYKIHTCNGLMMHTKKNLTGIKSLSEAKVEKICEAAEKIVNFGYMTGSDALLKRKGVVHITTRCEALDDLLRGGIETSAITEAFGEFSSLLHKPVKPLKVYFRKRDKTSNVAEVSDDVLENKGAYLEPHVINYKAENKDSPLEDTDKRLQAQEREVQKEEDNKDNDAREKKRDVGGASEAQP